MSLRISPDKNQPSVAIEYPLEQPLPDYDTAPDRAADPGERSMRYCVAGFPRSGDDARGY